MSNLSSVNAVRACLCIGQVLKTQSLFHVPLVFSEMVHLIEIFDVLEMSVVLRIFELGFWIY